MLRKRERDRDRQRQTDRDRQRHRNRDTDRDLIEPFIGVHSNSALGPNKQQILSFTGGQGR